MDFALPQHRTDRHPVGLLIVVALHALLAAVLVSARLAAHRPAEPPPIALMPLDPVKPVDPEPQKLPDPVGRQVLPLRVEPPLVDIEPPPLRTITSEREGPGMKTDVVRGGPDGDDDAVHEVARVLARVARIDAGAAQCRPGYPAAAQRAGATGVTRIRFSVDASGRIAGSQILQPSGTSREHRLMDRAAAEALSRCAVQVGTDEAGRPVGTTTDVEYAWTLN